MGSRFGLNYNRRQPQYMGWFCFVISRPRLDIALYQISSYRTKIKTSMCAMSYATALLMEHGKLKAGHHTKIDAWREKK
jgi:hypothetical protein